MAMIRCMYHITNLLLDSVNYIVLFKDTETKWLPDNHKLQQYGRNEGRINNKRYFNASSSQTFLNVYLLKYFLV